MNIFKIPKIDPEVVKKLNKRIVLVIVMALVCFSASLFVRFFISDRIDDARTAFTGIDKELPVLYVGDTELRRYENKSENLNNNFNKIIEKVSVTDPEIAISVNNLAQKTLGKQKFVSFDSTINTTESFTVPSDVKSAVIKIPVFSGSSVSEFNADVMLGNAKVPVTFSFYKDLNRFGGKDESYYYASIPQSLANKDIVLNASWVVKGSRSINLTEGKYRTIINTDWKNIRLNGSNYGKIEKDSKAKRVVFKIDESYKAERFTGFDSTDENYAGVNFMAGTDDITLTDRVTKYASLVILLTFFLIFILDMRRKFTANILQYVLVGASLCLFYLLNLSLGESVGFTTSYVVATLVTMLINGWYVANVFDSKKYGVITGSGLLVVYGVIYWLMRAETINLLAGTIVLYVVLMILMVNTAKINRNNN